MVNDILQDRFGSFNPQVVRMDIDMPMANGIEVLKPLPKNLLKAFAMYWKVAAHDSAGRQKSTGEF